MLPIRRAIWLCALVAVSAQYDCGLCPASGSPCCDCCVGGVLQAGLCNSVAYVACLPPPAPSSSSIPSRSPSSTVTPLNTPVVSGRPAALAPHNASATFTTPCVFATWTVPSGVTNISVFLWGAGGDKFNNLGRGAAYVDGIAYTTPGEQLRITVGGSTRAADEACGYPALGDAGYASGGFSAVSRLSASLGSWEYLVVAGGAGLNMFAAYLPTFCICRPRH